MMRLLNTEGNSGSPLAVLLSAEKVALVLAVVSAPTEDPQAHLALWDKQLSLHDDGPGGTFVRSLPHSPLQVLGNLIYEDTRNHLIFVILKDLWAKLVTVSVTHTQVIIDFDFHALPLQSANMPRPRSKYIY